MVEQMKALGLFGATIAEEYGGLGLSATTYAKIVQRVSEVWMSLSGIFNSHLIMAACVQRNGSEEQKRQYLPRFASGEIRGGLALTEPDCGTDLQAIRMRAVRDGDHYVINGTKTWISNGIHGQAFALLVKTDWPRPAHKGMTMFLAEKGRVSCRASGEDRLGIDRRADPRGFSRARLGRDRRRGPRSQTALGGWAGRIRRARGCGIAKAALDESVRYAQLRKTFGKPIAEHQAIQLKLAEMAIRTESAIALTYNAATAYDEGRRCDMEAGMAKYAASEAALANATDAMRIHGAYGYSKELNIERYYRDAPLLCIGEGTNELQRIIIARQLVERNPI